MALEEFDDEVERIVRIGKNDAEYIVRSARAYGLVSGGTQTINYLLNRNIQRVQGGVSVAIGAAASVALQDALRLSLPAIAAASQEKLVLFALSTKEQVNRKAGLLNVHRQLADEAHQLTINRYQERVGSKSHARYRQGQNRLTGQMEKALKNPQVVRAQRDGIIYGDTSVLDQTAAHWRRLNFGAGKRGRSRGVQPAPMYHNGQRTGQFLRFDQGGASPDFHLPRGMWFSGSSGRPIPFGAPRQGHQFYPWGMGMQRLEREGIELKLSERFKTRGGGSATYPTEGILGRHFFEAGLFHIGRHYLDRMEVLAEKWILDALDETSRTRGPFYKAGLIGRR